MLGLSGGVREVSVSGPATLNELWVRLDWGTSSVSGPIAMAGGSGSRLVPGIPADATVSATAFTDATLTTVACTSP